MTPLQAVDRRTPVADMGVLLPTARGNNPDVVAAVRLLAEQEPKSMLILCGNAQSRVASQVKQYRMVDFVSFDLPTGEDGFLATNSLLAFCVLLARAYLDVSGQSFELPTRFHDLLSDRRLGSTEAITKRRYAELLARNTLVVLHGPSTTAAAVDIESKFTEAALGYVQICDFRQFAHGRHHWLAKRAEHTAILSLETPDDEAVARQTLELLPKTLPTTRLRLSQRSWAADLAGIAEGFFLVSAAGAQRGIDPGRPRVPSFGRKLYHANAFRPRENSARFARWKARAIERKSSERLDQLIAEDRLSFWSQALDTVLDNLEATSFCGIVLDYDGTLCSEDQRFESLSAEVVNSLISLLKSGAQLGIATGRGKSVHTRLLEAISKKYWSQVIVGYYNGGQVLPLDAQEIPDGTNQVLAELAQVGKAMQRDPLLMQGTVTLRGRQITLSAPRGMSLETLCSYAESLVNRVSPHGIRVMRSGHSVDIVPEAVSKLAVVQRVKEMAGLPDSAAVLRIGDRGRWPGNDAQLLASPHGLSVHEVSSDAHSCWNIVPPGQRGWQATIWCLRHVKVSRGGIRFRLPATKD
jgi:hypothetical protein